MKYAVKLQFYKQRFGNTNKEKLHTAKKAKISMSVKHKQYLAAL